MFHSLKFFKLAPLRGVSFNQAVSHKYFPKLKFKIGRTGMVRPKQDQKDGVLFGPDGLLI